MYRWFRGLILLGLAIGLLAVVTGCHKREHHGVKVHEEQREGEVQDVSPGEMIVE
jgi:hypothetical protein